MYLTGRAIHHILTLIKVEGNMFWWNIKRKLWSMARKIYAISQEAEERGRRKNANTVYAEATALWNRFPLGPFAQRIFTWEPPETNAHLEPGHRLTTTDELVKGIWCFPRDGRSSLASLRPQERYFAPAISCEGPGRSVLRLQRWSFTQGVISWLRNADSLFLSSFFFASSCSLPTCFLTQ